jgi:anti-anti-sigma factor
MEELGADSKPEMTFDVVNDDGKTTVVTITGELDIASAGRLELAVAPIIGEGTERLVVDVSGLRFADSSAIALWVRWAAAVGQLELRDASPLLQRIIRSMGLDQRLRLL